MRDLETNNITDTSWLFDESIQIGKLILPIQYFHNSILFSGITDYKSEYFLIGDNILVVLSSGTPSLEDIEKGGKLIEKIVNEIDQDKCFLIPCF